MAMIWYKDVLNEVMGASPKLSSLVVRPHPLTLYPFHGSAMVPGIICCSLSISQVG